MTDHAGRLATAPAIVALAGASGFIGRWFREQFTEAGITVRTVGRHPEDSAHWDNPEAVADALNGANLLVNLAGRSVSCRYSHRNRDEILDSRTRTTSQLGCALALVQRQAGTPPSLWINASTGTIYRHAEDRPQTEADGELGTGFSVDVARAWEQALHDAGTPGVRQVALRIAIVLGPGGGVMDPFKNLARCGLGGHMGTGNQKFSWIHVQDLYRAVLHLYAHQELSGPVNAAAPEVVSNRELMQCVRRAYRVPAGLPTPRWLLELGAVMIRTETELVLKSRWVGAEKLALSGFAFRYPNLDAALASIAGRPAISSAALV
jgi:uncharacterized protein (TIGR01777 family)